MSNRIALVGMACRYPDADSPKALWENVLAKRRAFRRIPSERLNLADYFSSDPSVPDAIYCNQLAVIEGYEFDRVKYRVAGNTYRSTDMTHWLALDIAAQAIADAGFPDGKGLSKERTGVLVGNTLTGEFSRAAMMRLRWPFVRRMVEAELLKQGWDTERRKSFLIDLEANYKKPFEPVGEETLAGGLSNTIAGRICNHFDFKGGGYTLDGACSSSLLAIANACSALVAGDIDTAVVGGVDLSLDPFELIGFSKVGAFAPEEMRVYDAVPNGFLPGEGCGFVVLMRHDDALACGARCYALIRGWGISSDGSGGLTRPEEQGQRLALDRAYQRAGYNIDTVTLFEGHGTGTPIGDEVELRTLNTARHTVNSNAPAAVISSIKANIGHTKAAAGVAGLLKAVMAIHHQILPPATGFKRLHPVLESENVSLKLLSKGEAWPDSRPLRAGVSSFGFGGINVHLALEGVNNTRRTKLIPQEQKLLASPPDCELFLFGADDLPSLSALLQKIAEIAPRLSLGELTDLAATLARQNNRYSVRAAIIAATPAQLAESIEHLYTKIKAGEKQVFDIKIGILLSAAKAQPRITLLFPGQASPVRLNGDIWARRFAQVEALYERAKLPTGEDLNSTDIAQPAIITAELAGLQLLESLSIKGQLAIGHSVGEFAALHWAGAMDEATVLDLVRVRGRAMAEVTGPAGTMLSLAADGEQAKNWCAKQEGINVACFNSPNQTVISGEIDGIERLKQSIKFEGIKSTLLPVSHGFHSHLMKPAAKVLEAHLSEATLHPLQQRVISTITGAELANDADLTGLLKKQITHPVLFSQAIRAVVPETDLFIETGPGQVLTALVAEMSDVPIVTLDAAGPSLQGFNMAVGAAYVMGVDIKREALFADRFTRPFSLEWQPKFFVNPCELAPLPNETLPLTVSPDIHSVETSESLTTDVDKNSKSLTKSDEVSESKQINVLKRLRTLVAKSIDLPTSAIDDNHRLLTDLHLNSITVGQIVTEIGRQIGLQAPSDPTAYADASLTQIAAAMEERMASGELETEPKATLPAGIDAWVRPFTVEQVERPLRGKPLAPKGHGGWHFLGTPPTGLEQALNTWGGGGVVLCLPVEIPVMLEAAKMVLNNTREHSYFVLVQHDDMSVAAFARTLHREQPDITTCVITLPLDDKTVERILAEIQMAHQIYHEIYYNPTRCERVLKPLKKSETDHQVLTADDVLLVTGGGKGITAECAAVLARDTGVRLVLLGRASPENDTELSKNLARFQSMGIHFNYFQTDVTDAEAVKATVAEVGIITAILHGAGTNQPKILRDLDKTDFQRTLAPKVDGLRHILAAIDPKPLRLLISFGSIIATTGMPGNADYAVANEWLASITADFQKAHSHCRCLTLEWTVWSEVGMGRRLGSDEILAQQGITPIPPDVGVALFRQAVMAKDWPTTVVITGRMPDVPTLRLERPDMPFLRFLEQPRVYYPGIELVVEAEISLTSDPYLNDHVYKGQRLFPAVMGLEAMAQVASTALGVEEVPVFEKLNFIAQSLLIKRDQKPYK
jgi:enediyne polyketide synthase